MSRPSGNVCRTVGGKILRTRKRCLGFVGSNSRFCGGNILRRITPSLSDSVIIKGVIRNARI